MIFYNREKHDSSPRLRGGGVTTLAGGKVLIVAAILPRWMTIVKGRLKLRLDGEWSINYSVDGEGYILDEKYSFVLFSSNGKGTIYRDVVLITNEHVICGTRVL